MAKIVSHTVLNNGKGLRKKLKSIRLLVIG